MKQLILLLFPILLLSQYNGNVGINTTEPTNTLDINGDLRIRNILNSQVANNTYILIVDEHNVVKKILLSSLFTIQDEKCPQFIYNKSNPYYIVFKAEGYLTNPNDPIKANNLNFVSAGTYIENNTTYYTYTNTSGSPLNIDNFTVVFGTNKCNYK